jgi:predicted metal-binding membrane protein
MTMNQPDSFFESVLQRDRAIVTAALVVYPDRAVLLLGSQETCFRRPGMTPEMNMPGMNMGPVSKPWSIAELAVTFVNVVGNDDRHDDTVGGAVIHYALVARHAEANGKL